jgi:hypothetical protein
VFFDSKGHLTIKSLQGGLEPVQSPDAAFNYTVEPTKSGNGYKVTSDLYLEISELDSSMSDWAIRSGGQLDLGLRQVKVSEPEEPEVEGTRVDMSGDADSPVNGQPEPPSDEQFDAVN